MKRKRRFKLDFWTIITIIIVIVFALFLVYPLLSLFASGFQDPDTQEFTLANFLKFFQKKYYYRTLWHSFLVTTCTTFLAILIGAPLAYFSTVYKVKGKGMMDILIIISMLSPPFIGAYSWIILGGRSGIVTKFFLNVFGITTPSVYGFGGILLVLTLKLYPYI
ncbi:MAG: iron ABC transporter permease, partial [Mobilitalea sp.]